MRKKTFFPKASLSEQAGCNTRKGRVSPISQFITQMLGTVNNLYVNRIEVSPRDRKKFLLPFVHLCYDHDSPFKIKGPKYFAELLYLAVDFKKSNDSDESLSVEEIDCEIQRLKRTLFDD